MYNDSMDNDKKYKDIMDREKRARLDFNLFELYKINMEKYQLLRSENRHQLAVNALVNALYYLAADLEPSAIELLERINKPQRIGLNRYHADYLKKHYDLVPVAVDNCGPIRYWIRQHGQRCFSLDYFNRSIDLTILRQ